MECRKCEHYEACVFWCGMGVEKAIPNNCKLFKDKEKIIELPLKIGDTVYHIMKKAVTHWEDDKCVVDSEGEYKIYEQKFSLSLYSVFGFGENLFATREEAEQALANKQ